MERVEEPGEEHPGVALLRDLELLLGAENDRLQHLVRRHVSFEVLRVPQLPDELPEPGDQLEALVPGGSGGQDVHVVLLVQEVVPHSLHVRQSLQDHVHVVVGLDVVEADHSRDVLGPIIGSRFLGAVGEPLDQIRCEGWIENVENVAETRINDLIVVGETVELLGLQVEEDPVVVTDGVGVGVRVTAAALEIFPAHQAGVAVDPGQGDRAQLLEVEVQEAAVDGVEVGALPAGHQPGLLGSQQSRAWRLIVRVLGRLRLLLLLSLQILLTDLRLHSAARIVLKVKHCWFTQLFWMNAELSWLTNI